MEPPDMPAITANDDEETAEPPRTMSSVWRAVKAGQRAKVRRFLARNPQLLNSRHFLSGWTPLLYALLFRHHDLVEDLLRRSASVDVVDDHGNCALSIVVCNGDVKGLVLLLDHGCDVGWRDPRSQRTLLMQAVALGHVDLVRELAIRNADFTARDEDGNTVLHLAVIVGDAGLTAYVASFFNTIDVRNNADKSPLLLACEAGNMDIVQVLRDRAATLGAAYQNERAGSDNPGILTPDEADNSHPRFELDSHVAPREGYEREGRLLPLVAVDPTAEATDRRQSAVRVLLGGGASPLTE